MTQNSMREYVEAVRQRYFLASKREKGKDSVLIWFNSRQSVKRYRMDRGILTKKVVCQ